MGKLLLFFLTLIFIFCNKSTADESIPIKVESWIVREPSLQYMISLENISDKPLKIRYVDIEESGKWLAGSLFLSGDGRKSFPHLHGSHFLTEAEEYDANRLIEVQPADVRMTEVMLENIYQVDIKDLRFISFQNTIIIGNDRYYVNDYFFDVMKYCSNESREKHAHEIIKNSNWDNVKEVFERQKREAERVPKYLRNF